MLTAIGDVMRRLYERGWITTRDGNTSLRRTGEQRIYITPSGWRKAIVYPEHIIRIEMCEDNSLAVPEGPTPSAELHMHHLLLASAAKTRAVVHAHPTHVVAALYRGFNLVALGNEFPEIFRYTRIGPSVPAIPATTAALGDATADAFGVVHGTENPLSADIVGQHNHGVCAVATNPWAAFEHIERLDHVCEIVLASGVTPAELKDRSAQASMHA